MKSNYLMKVENMQLWGNHGNFPDEMERGQKFLVDVELSYDMEAMSKSDTLEQGLSYLTVYDTVKRVITQERHKLLQRMAYRICEELFTIYPPLYSVRATVKKPAVPIQGIVDNVSITVEQIREE